MTFSTAGFLPSFDFSEVIKLFTIFVNKLLFPSFLVVYMSCNPFYFNNIYLNSFLSLFVEKVVYTFVLSRTGFFGNK